MSGQAHEPSPLEGGGFMGLTAHAQASGRAKAW